MKLTDFAALILVVVFDFILTTSFNVTGARLGFEFYVSYAVHFLCYFFPMMLFFGKDKAFGIHPFHSVIISGSLLFYIYEKISRILGDLRYLSAYPENLFERHFEAAFLRDLLGAIFFGLTFLVIACLLRLANRIITRPV